MKKSPTSARFFADGLDHPEGLAFDRRGYLWAGGEAGQVYRISPSGKGVKLMGQVDGFCLGLAFAPDQSLLICRVKPGALIRFDPNTGESRVFARQAGRHRLKHPNYPVFDAEGNLYVSDSGDWGQSNGRIYRFDPQGRGELWYDRLSFANGLALTSGHLYVAQSTAGNILRIPILPSGEAGPAVIHASDLDHVPDGLAFDQKGNLFVCCYGNSRIYRISPRGQIRIFAEDPTGVVINRSTNLAFGGPRNNRLFIANLGGYHISVIDTEETASLLVR